MGLMGGLSTTTLIPHVACLQYVSDSCKPSTSGLECSVIFNNTLINLIVLNPKKDPLTQATVIYNDLANHLHIIYYLTGTDFAQSLIP